MSNDKYQAGETYKDATKAPAYSLDDPLPIAQDLVKELAGVLGQVSVKDVLGILESLTQKPLNDKTGSTEALIGVLTALSSKSYLRTFLTNKLIDTLWNNLQHPPLSYVGGDVKYEVLKESDTGFGNADVVDAVQFRAPDSDVILREQIPTAPDGLYQYRMPDGSYNNILTPNLGRAGTPYAKTVRNLKSLQGVKPDPGLLFDLLMARDDKHFKENPGGISSMFFYHAAIIIHDVFRTSRTDQNKSDTSSYLDLAPLYGSSLSDQLEIRTMKGGLLKPDTFHEKRLLGQPDGVSVMLVLYSRFHNYVADILLKINENGRFTLSCAPDAGPEELARAVAKQDYDLFNTARLVVGGLYINICLHDYLRAITNTHHSASDWTLDPRVEMEQKTVFDGEGTPRGVGNQVSVEFNLLYRFHSCISKKDERWINNFFLQLFPGRNVDELQDVSWVELGQALLEFEQRTPKDPSVRTFGGLTRGADGKFKDDDLVRILKEAMDDPAGIFGARTIPKALKIVEVLGIKQARGWQVGSLNEFREFFGLKRHQTFKDINSDPEIANLLEKLYTDPDMVELYPGLMIEDFKPVRNTGCGISPPYSLGRAVLSDAVTLVRSDRFNTIDYTVSNLTAWGYNEVQHDSKTLGGSMLYKLIQRGVPGWFPFNSVAVMQPMYTKTGNEKIAREIGTMGQYTLDGPRPPPVPVPIFTSAAIKEVLGNPKQYAVPWLPAVNSLFPGEKDLGWFMLAGDNAANYAHRASMEKAMSKIPDLAGALRDFMDQAGSRLIDRETFALSAGLNQLDLIRDIAVPLNAQLLADLFYFDMRTDENPGGSLSATELYTHLLDIRVWGVNNNDPAQAWNRRRRAQEGAQIIIDSTRKLVDRVVLNQATLGLGGILTSAVSGSNNKKGSLRSCGEKLVKELLAQGNSPERVVDALWLTAFGGIGVPVTAFYEVMEFFLRPENGAIWAEVQDMAKKNDSASLHAYVAEAQRLTSSQRNMRIATQPATLEGKSIQPGNLVVLMIAAAARNPSEVADATKFDPKRVSDSVTAFSYGKHQCFGRNPATAFLDGLVKLAAGLKNLRPAPGEMGRVKTIQLGSEKAYLNDSWSYLGFDASSWKVHFDGHGQGTFTGDREPTALLDLQQYYGRIQKRAAEILKGGEK
ncbi:linoleate diol synthase [Lasiosphaeria miniovina]|uniref:linoleate 8R-lipoxygenase n=1 Tax=Lasiosphaeria miniovina TaxID=1954250 RepID=A0AA40AMN7_9PEZI|nr:linoleate diol synthase [Lasiosphaeria miniovina]KAK0718667.1 linoleate diol synthase [Lasiosphaeria miniovina]